MSIPPQNNTTTQDKITDKIKSTSMETWYKIGLVIYCICIIILFTRNPYDIIT